MPTRCTAVLEAIAIATLIVAVLQLIASVWTLFRP